MPHINKLELSVANLIAAGEVVDRPSSVLKELLENAIDAGASAVTAEIRRGGISLIRVTDDGCGMTPEDLPLSVLRHATSKISRAEDLSEILTLGFRGEALAAISAVSDVRILTRTADADVGALLEAEAGRVPRISEVGCARGTTVLVENLFSNVPARQKFLKSDRTEAQSCSFVAEKVALSHPEIRFTYLSDGAEKFTTAGDGNRKNALYSVFGRQFAASLVPVKEEAGGILVSGYIGTPAQVHANRSFENFFINGRYIRSKTATAAVEQAYQSYLPEGKFPTACLWITLSPGVVDVNVHPAKLEVKFSNERAVFEAVYYAVRTAIKNDVQRAALALPAEEKTPAPAGQSESFRLPLSTVSVPMRDRTEPKAPADTLFDAVLTPRQEKTLPRAATEPLFPSFSAHAPLSSAPPSDFYAGYQKYAAPPAGYEGPAEPAFAKSAPPAEQPEESAARETPARFPIRYLGIAFETYILAERGDELLIIDKHAAHERVIYESLIRTRFADDAPPQLLLVPIRLRLTPVETAALEEYGEDVRRAGFEFTVSDDGADVTQIPGILTPPQAADLLSSAASLLAEGSGVSAVRMKEDLFRRSLYTASCKAAMKGGRYDGEEHLRWLCGELSRCEDIRVCPHGRPVVTVLSRAYLDRSFQRTK
ncbi:MAG: DNA mismatch repair endonuclease MutL [Clostridia bacterium]|nr:DNA mismatch repair endonuclease MutL [Clostridia bacterium]